MTTSMNRKILLLLSCLLLSVVSIIIAKPYIDYNIQKNWQYQVYSAIDNNKFEYLNELLTQGAIKKFSIDFFSQEGYTPFMRVLSTGNKKLILSFLEYGANPNFKDKLGKSPLYKSAYVHCCEHPDYEIPFLLIKYGADLKKSAYFDKDRKVLLSVSDAAVINGENLKLIEYLLQKGGNPNSSWIEVGDACSLLYVACEQANVDSIKLLLKYGADPNKPNEELSQLYLLLIASSPKIPIKEKIDLLQLFFKHDAKVKLIPISILKNGDNILQRARKDCPDEIVKLLESNLETK